jgi:CBS domain containing-hemolysin-like protein
MTLAFTFVGLLAEGGALAREWDSGAGIFLQWAIVIGLVLLNGFFVAAEFAIVKVRGSQIEALEAQGDRRAAPARRAVEHLDAYLSATQLGITLASLGLGWVGEPYLARMLQPLMFRLGVESEAIIRTTSFIVAFSAITFLHIVLGELAPKSLAIRKSVGTTLRVAAPLGWFYVLFKPAIWFLNGTANWLLRHVLRIQPATEHELAHSEEELRLILAQSAEAREVSAMGKELLINALDLRDRVVRDIATPRGDVVFLNTEDTFEENLKRAVESRHTRFPLCRGHLDDAIGLVHIKDLLKLVREPKADIGSIKREMHNVPEMMPLERLLSFFLGRHAHLALVVDEFGGAAGIVTLDNVLEELVGDIQDEFDAEKPELRKVSRDEFVVAATLGLHELNEMLDLELESTEVSTVGGYITQVIGHLPKAGERARIEDFEATVTKADGRRVIEIHFKRRVPEGESHQPGS